MFWFGSLLADTLYLSAIVIFSTLTYYYYRFLYWQKNHVPYIPPSFPFGNVKPLFFSEKSFGQTVHSLYTEFRKRGVKYGGFYMMATPAFIVMDPELIKTMLTKDFQHFHDRNIFSDGKIDPLSEHLFAVCGTQWKNLRKKITPTFTSGKMKMMFNTLLKCAEELEGALEPYARTSEPLNAKDVLAKFTTDVIGSCVFGIECNSLKDSNNEFYYYGKLFMSSSMVNNLKLMFGMVGSGLLQFLRVRQINPVVSKFFMGALKDTIEHREQSGVRRNDFVEMFIKMKHNQSIQDDSYGKVGNPEDAITFNELAAQAFLFFIAGFDTSSTTLTFCLYELSLQIEIQQKLRNEILTVLNKYSGNITYDGLMQMEYMDKVIKETLRKYPSAPMLNRQCTQDYKIPDSNVVLKKGTPLWVSVYGLQNDEEYYPNPDQFDPERFSPTERAKRHPFTYLAFGEGPRNCIGMRFALMEMKIALSILLRSYKFSLDSKTKLPIEFQTKGILLATKQDIWLGVSKYK